MSNKNKLNMKAVAAVVVGVVIFVAAVTEVYVVGEQHARQKTEDLLSYSCTDLPETVRGNLNFMFLMEAKLAASKIGAGNYPSPAEMHKIVDSMAIDELYVVDCYGKVRASAEPSVVGRNLSNVPQMIEFLSLLETPDHVVQQPIRLSLVDSKTEVSYGGFPQPDGSLIICGYTVDHLRENFIEAGNDLMSTWEVGDTGGYVVIDDATGKLVFDFFDEAKAGDQFVDFGDPAVLTANFDVDTSHVGVLFGNVCHYRVFNFLGLRLVGLIAHDEYYGHAKVMTLSVAVALLLIFGIFGVVIRQMMVVHRTIAKIREAEDKQRLKDMVMATSIQKHSLPTSFPPYPKYAGNIDIYAFMQTAKEVGGDFYDFYFVGSGKIAVVIADVSGKGVPAAMFMMRAKTTLQGMLKGGKSLSEAVAMANDRLCEGNMEDMFVTAWVGVCDLHTGELEYVNAGHNPPFIRRADGSLEWIRQRSGLALAAMEGLPYRSHKLKLNLGDGLVLYTDGVTEAQDVGGNLYGEDWLEQATLQIGIDQDAHQYCDSITASLSAFVGKAEQADDITMLAFRMKRYVEAVSPRT